MEIKMKMQKNTMENVNFQIRESSASLNIPTSTPAPDRGGPVACPGGIVKLDPIICLNNPID